MNHQPKILLKKLKKVCGVSFFVERIYFLFMIFHAYPNVNYDYFSTNFEINVVFK